MAGPRGGPATELLRSLPLVDHHCHGVVAAELDRPGFEALLSEGGAPPPHSSNFDTPVGLAVRRHCAPALGLAVHAEPDRYLARRAELGSAATGRLLESCGLESLLVDTGFCADRLLSPADLADQAGAHGYEIVRLERVAEDVLAAGVEPSQFEDVCAQAIEHAVRSSGAVGLKSVAAYRTGFRLDPAPPAAGEVEAAVRDWQAAGHDRLVDPVLERYLLWTAVEFGLPLQVHVGLGDRDVRLQHSDPALLTDWLRRIPDRAPVLLLHCYPFLRAAGYLAHVFPQVHVDAGLALTFVGPLRSAAVLAELCELAPFDRVLFSTDGFGLAELYLIATTAFRRGLGTVLDELVTRGEWTAEDAMRVARLIGADNARRVYRLPSG